jgi:hypothetical protein
MLACVCTPPDTRLFSTTSVGGTKIKTPSRRRITEGPSFASLPVPTTHLPSRRSPPAATSTTTVANSLVVTTPVTENELATPDPKESEDNSADVQVRSTVLNVSSHISSVGLWPRTQWHALRTSSKIDFHYLQDGTDIPILFHRHV